MAYLVDLPPYYLPLYKDLFTFLFFKPAWLYFLSLPLLCAYARSSLGLGNENVENKTEAVKEFDPFKGEKNERQKVASSWKVPSLLPVMINLATRGR